MKFRFGRPAVIVVVVLLALVGCTSEGEGPDRAQDNQLTRVLEKKRIRIGVLTDAPPWGVQDSGGGHKGYDVDIATALGESLGAEVEFVAATNANRVPLIQTRKVDVLIAALSSTNERAQSVAMSEPYAVSAHGIMVPKDSAIRAYAELAGAKVSATSGSQPADILQSEFPDADAQLFTNVADSVQALESGKVDALIESQAVIAQLIKDSGDKYRLVEGPPIRPGFASFGVQQGSPVWLNYLNNFIRNYLNSAQAGESSQKWFGVPVADLIR